MKTLVQSIIAIVGVSLLCSCAHMFGNQRYFQNRDSEHLTAHDGAPLVVPPPLTDKNITNYYRIAPVKGELGVSDVPPNSSVIKVSKSNEGPYLPGVSAGEIKDVDISGKHLLLVNRDFDQTWALVGSGLRRQGLTIKHSDHQKKTYDVYSPRSMARHGKQIKIGSLKGLTAGKYDGVPSYQIYLQTKNKGQTLVGVRSSDDRAINPNTAELLLNQVNSGMQNKSRFSLSSFFKKVV